MQGVEAVGGETVGVDAGEQVDDLLLGGALGVEAAGPLDLGDIVAADLARAEACPAGLWTDDDASAA
ncbi:hypothetical protein ACFZDG_25995 [Kitasatospora xanthocidica]|uniref:hypothetical protein n=1 Tax=Kitasatospora xanthocidica TaxID=83382 RepID=UPI0036E1BC07